MTTIFERSMRALDQMRSAVVTSEEIKIVAISTGEDVEVAQTRVPTTGTSKTLPVATIQRQYELVQPVAGRR